MIEVEDEGNVMFLLSRNGEKVDVTFNKVFHASKLIENLLSVVFGAMWWLALKNSPDVTCVCCKRQLKGVGQKTDNLYLLRKKNFVTKLLNTDIRWTDLMVKQTRTEKRFLNFRIGSWNVLSLHKTGVVKQLLSQMDNYGLDTFFSSNFL